MSSGIRPHVLLLFPPDYRDSGLLLHFTSLPSTAAYGLESFKEES